MLTFRNGAKKISVHIECLEWTPEIYYDEERNCWENVRSALARASKLKCSHRGCGLTGAALGCSVENCAHTFHYRCARDACAVRGKNCQPCDSFAAAPGCAHGCGIHALSKRPRARHELAQHTHFIFRLNETVRTRLLRSGTWTLEHLECANVGFFIRLDDLDIRLISSHMTTRAQMKSQSDISPIRENRNSRPLACHRPRCTRVHTFPS